MRRFFSVLALIFILLGFGNTVSLANGGILIEALTFEAKGAAFLILYNLYGGLALLFSIMGNKNIYRMLLLAGSTLLIAVNLALSFVAVYGFQQP
ncbi:hypothetical protein [Jeotgalibacillus salarius]|uniref:MFS transporter n=1 Tax=Jeotgalibacillus salarius TaxID=546023 RepID=A0A4Y8LEM7_9BACL|nr:hypothetical protein [Jeotgalibacillus salarius]TFD99460.1 hypothetical protein E2626_14470 [Jeotgalibacillus salarius]